MSKTLKLKILSSTPLPNGTDTTVSDPIEASEQPIVLVTPLLAKSQLPPLTHVRYSLEASNDGDSWEVVGSMVARQVGGVDGRNGSSISIGMLMGYRFIRVAAVGSQSSIAAGTSRFEVHKQGRESNSGTG